MLTLEKINTNGKRILVREDFNVPLDNGKVSNAARIDAALPTIQYLRNHGASIILMSHLGRPNEGNFQSEYSLRPVADYLSYALEQPVPLISNWSDGITLASGDIVLLENVRFNSGEKANDDQLAKNLAALCDVFVMDAFGTAHRSHASTYGVAKYAPIACAGPLLVNELKSLSQALKNPAKPVIAIVGGAKVSTKLTVLESLTHIVDQLIVGGGIANTFIAAQGYSVGQSLYEDNLLDQAKALLKKIDIPLPLDVIVTDELTTNAVAHTTSISDVRPKDKIVDIGPKTIAHYSDLLQQANTIIWNGPVGVFEFDQFANGTREIGQAIASSNAFSLAGGGDTLAAIDKFNLREQISYISTGGGAFLEYIEGKQLPAMTILEEKI